MKLWCKGFNLSHSDASKAFSILAKSLTSSSPKLPLPSDLSPPNEAVVDSVVTVLTLHRSKSRWNYLKTLHPTGFTPSDFTHISLRLRNKPHLLLRLFRFSVRNSLTPHSLLSLTSLIHLLSRSRLKPQTLSLILFSLRSFQFDPVDLFDSLAKTYRLCDSAPFVFDLLIRACLHSNLINAALAIAQKLRSRAIYPSASTCNSIVRSVAKSQGSDNALAIYRELFGLDLDSHARAGLRVFPTVQTFNTLMLSFYREREFGRLEEVRAEMARHVCDLNVSSYCILMAGFCDCGKIGEAQQLWDEMRIKGVEPDIVAYNTLIGGYCEIGDIEKAERLYRDLVFGEIEPTSATFDHLIRGYSKVGDVASALVLYEDMCNKDFLPETVTIEALIGAMCGMNRVSEGLGVLRDVMTRELICASRLSYEFLIKGFCAQGKMDEALKIQAEMVGKGYVPNLEIYGSFVAGYEKLGDIEKVAKLRNEMFELGLSKKR